MGWRPGVCRPVRAEGGSVAAWAAASCARPDGPLATGEFLLGYLTSAQEIDAGMPLEFSAMAFMAYRFLTRT
jgi:hypothetical protein